VTPAWLSSTAPARHSSQQLHLPGWVAQHQQGTADSIRTGYTCLAEWQSTSKAQQPAFTWVTSARLSGTAPARHSRQHSHGWHLLGWVAQCQHY